MGCDIHLYVENRRFEDGAWVARAEKVPNKYYDPNENDGERELEIEGERFYNGRNYRLFGMLADVRNGCGFAGCDTGDAPKGLPDDVTAIIKEESESWGLDGHSHSWLTVQELLDYDWTRRIKNRGVVDFLTWAEFQRQLGFKDILGDEVEPKSAAGMVSGARVRNLTPTDAQVALAAIKKRAEEKADRPGEPYPSSKEFIEATAEYFCVDVEELIRPFCGMINVFTEWETSYFTLASEFLSTTLPKLLRLGKPEDVRIVFWFDN
jgi:hypothetical protein